MSYKCEGKHLIFYTFISLHQYYIMLFSIICVSNNNTEFLKMKESLDRQLFKDFEIIYIDSVKCKFNSASEALNYGGTLASGDYLIFLHQDIILEENTLYELKKYLSTQKNLGIGGVAGAPYNFGKTISNITHGPNREPVSSNDFYNCINVETVDECFFVIPHKIFDILNFNISNKTWHLYAVEYSIEIKNKGYDVIFIPLKLHHNSKGASINKSYYKELYRYIKLFKKRNPCKKNINTPMGLWNTNRFILKFQIIKHYIKCIILIKFNRR